MDALGPLLKFFKAQLRWRLAILEATAEAVAGCPSRDGHRHPQFLTWSALVLDVAVPTRFQA